MQVTFGEDGSGFSKLPLFLEVVGNIAGDAPPLMLPLFLSLRLSEVERRFGGSRTPARPGLKIFLDEILMWLWLPTGICWWLTDGHGYGVSCREQRMGINYEWQDVWMSIWRLFVDLAVLGIGQHKESKKARDQRNEGQP
ncbi:hypothetical protein E3N88_05418 [Mikania micrantha]|uniref:Uncharacterized protein n=1 Tax=Mikania micrantha TaxID=192012 RepID=A0A5N6PLN3_9ASTR|nr:hypothetical protein E3N88_05418 [Mikania micrantha]